MIVSHRAPSSLNMSSYRAIWTNFKPNSIISEQIKIPKSIHLNFQISGKYVLIREGIFPEIWKLRYMDFGVFNFSKILEFDLKWIHMAQQELMLRLDGALWLRIIFKPLLTPKRGLPMATPPIEEALVEMCARSRPTVYICMYKIHISIIVSSNRSPETVNVANHHKR